MGKKLIYRVHDLINKFEENRSSLKKREYILDCSLNTALGAVIIGLEKNIDNYTHREQTIIPLSEVWDDKDYNFINNTLNSLIYRHIDYELDNMFKK